jgi:hypothetical protein
MPNPWTAIAGERPAGRQGDPGLFGELAELGIDDLDDDRRAVDDHCHLARLRGGRHFRIVEIADAGRTVFVHQGRIDVERPEICRRVDRRRQIIRIVLEEFAAIGAHDHWEDKHVEALARSAAHRDGGGPLGGDRLGHLEHVVPGLRRLLAGFVENILAIGHEADFGEKGHPPGLIVNDV